MGVETYCKSLPHGVITDGLRPSIERGYLAIHAAWRMVKSQMLPEHPFRLSSPVESGGPYRYLAETSWDSPEAVVGLFAKGPEELRATPLIKLRGKERDTTQALATYGRGSGLAKALLGATAPATVTERMAFVRLGLDPDAKPHAVEF